MNYDKMISVNIYEKEDARRGQMEIKSYKKKYSEVLEMLFMSYSRFRLHWHFFDTVTRFYKINEESLRTDFLKFIFSIVLIDFTIIENGIIFIVAIISPLLTIQLFCKVAIVILLEILLNLRILSSFIN